MRIEVVLLGMAWASCALGAEPPPTLPPTVENFRSGTPRPFVQSSLTAGLPIRGAVGVGYGRPYYLSIALDGIGFLTPFYTQAGVALTGSLPLVQVELGLARVHTFRVGALPRQPSYEQADLDSRRGSITYTALNATLYGTLPLRPFVLLVRGQLISTPSLGHQVAFLETNRFVMRAPLAGFGRYFPLYAFGDDASIRAGAVVETLFPGGGAATLVRVGPCFMGELSAHTDLTLFAALPVAGPDDIGLAHGLGGSLALRYRAASGERHPFP